ncbi:DNA-binding protein [Neolentinus lepideus HHB14362 ss-1]|uniref:DNA-binding protein n=1 Tax=Neolentinus lepideus HHB14362 ss-1 TaxID=1314782 RepID=A0A165W8W3_9AGAM|nr:DNA-binding protein [Neolentinus lepideus HHB14362 ss-1]
MSTRAYEPLSYNETVKGIVEFIEVAIHTILYVRQVYPADLFVRRKKYYTPVYQSRHPGLNEYISGAVKAVGEELVLGNVDKIVVVIKDKNEVALERYIFVTETMLHVAPYDKDTNVEEAMSPTDMGQYFRSFIIKLHMIESQLGPMPAGEISFAIVLELKDDQAPSTSQGQDAPPWMPAVSQHTTAGASDKAELHFLRSLDTGIINLSMAVQESEQKLRREGLLPDTEKGKGKTKSSDHPKSDIQLSQC